MIVWLKNWLLGVVCAAMLAAVADGLAPEGAVKRVSALAGGLVLILAVVSPVMKVDGKKIEGLVGEYSAITQDYHDELQKMQADLYESIIAENAAAYISDKAKELGIICSVSVTVGWDGGVPRLHAVKIKGMWTKSQCESLKSAIERDLGVPAAMQYFEESEL